MNILVFAPHPDDAVIGAGGSLAKLAATNHSITVLYLTSGEAGSIQFSKTRLAKIREKEARTALEILGIKEAFFFRHHDGYLEYNKNNLIEITKWIRKMKPDIVYIPHPEEQHPDHRITAQLVLRSISMAAGPWFQECKGDPWQVKKTLAYEVWTPLQTPSLFEDISDVMEKKMEALRAHKSQVDTIQYDEAIRGLNRYRGVMSGISPYCECFSVITEMFK